jgi:heavy metal sensor kinase
MSRFRDEMRALRTGFLVALPAALLLIAVGGWWVSQRALRPVRRITAAAEGITARGLDQRIPHSNEDVEFNRLISVFNGMMDRLEKSFQQAVRFSADAAHELKTPLTILQGELEQALQAAPPGSPQQQAYGALLEEVQRLKVIIRKLLLLSLADSGQLKPNFETLDLSAVMQAAIEDAAILAPGLRIEHTIEPGITVAADGDLLRQVVQNLVSNAIKYNRPEGTVSFVLRRAGANVLLTVSNTGAGIPPEDRGKVFERFYRGDKARNRNVDGLGLGLSLSREIARAHHGDLVLENTPGGTTVFTLILPGITSTTGASNALT